MTSPSNDTIRINAIELSSVCDGPGVRLVVFLQGCSRKCFGCHNPETWSSEDGNNWLLYDLLHFIIDHNPTRRITISGGEPLEQFSSTYKLIQMLRHYDKNYDIALYTSFEIEDIPSNLLDSLDYVKTGKYIDELRITTKQFIGSSNQSFIKLNRESKHVTR